MTLHARFAIFVRFILNHLKSIKIVHDVHMTPSMSTYLRYIIRYLLSDIKKPHQIDHNIRYLNPSVVAILTCTSSKA